MNAFKEEISSLKDEVKGRQLMLQYIHVYLRYLDIEEYCYIIDRNFL